MRRRDNSKPSMEIPRKAEERPFDLDSMPWVNEYDHAAESGLDIFSGYDDILEVVSEIACPSPGMTVLDIGAGTGNLSFRRFARGAGVVGLHPSEKTLVKARAKAKSAHLESKECRDARPGPEGIREMVRVLRPGGTWAMGEVAFKDAAAELEAKRTLPWLDEDEYYCHGFSGRQNLPVRVTPGRSFSQRGQALTTDTRLGEGITWM